MRTDGVGNPPRVSIGLPVYNGEPFLAVAIESLRSQDFEDWELIISDNASTDATPEICAKYADLDPRIRWVRSETNRGAAWNYNATFSLARGELFRWHAHDDGCEPGHLSACVAALDAHPEAVLAFTWTRFVDESGATVRLLDDQLKVTAASAHERLEQAVRTLFDCNAVFGVVRREVLARTRLIASFHPSDIPLLYELSLFGPFVAVPEHLFVRRRHVGGSLEANRTRRARKRWYDPSAPRGDLLLAWGQLRAHLGAVRRSGLPAGERARCYRVVLAVWPVQWARQSKRRIVREWRFRRRGRAGTRWR